MAAGDRMMSCRGATLGGAAVADVTRASISHQAVLATDPGGAGQPGPAAVIVTHQRLTVTLYGRSLNALLTALAAAAGALVLKTFGLAGALEKLTVKSVKFHSLGAGGLSGHDQAGGATEWSIVGEAIWISSDTMATMLVAATDS